MLETGAGALDTTYKKYANIASVHLYSTHSSSSNDYFVPRSYYIETNQSVRITGAKIWNDLPSELKNKGVNTSHRLMFK